MEIEQIKELSKIIGGYAGGQLSISRVAIAESDHKRYRGTIENIAMEDDKLKIKLAWNATLVPLKTRKDRTKWVRYDELNYVFDLKKYEISQSYDHSEGRVLDFGEGCTLRYRPDNETIYLTGPRITGR
jgi:hypothetical protein